MSFFVESAKSDLYKLYRPKKSCHDAPRLWWKYSILATIYRMRHSQRSDLWTVVSHRNMDILHNLRKALKIKSLMVDPSTLLEIFDENEALRRLEREMEVLKKENELLRQIVAKACTPNIILEDTQCLDYCQIFTDDGSSVTISLRDLLKPTDATIENRTLKSSKPSTASASNSPIRAALTSAGLIFGGSPEDSLNSSTMELAPLAEIPEDGAIGSSTAASPGRSTILRTAGTAIASAPGAFTSLNAVAPISPYLDLSTSARVPSAKIYREEPEIMRGSTKAATGGGRATMMSGASSSSKKMTGSEAARAKRNATIMARANEAMQNIEQQQQAQLTGESSSGKQTVSPLKSSSSTAALEDSLSSLLVEQQQQQPLNTSPAAAGGGVAAFVSPESPSSASVPAGPTSYDLAVAALQVTIESNATATANDEKSVRSGMSSVKTKHSSHVSPSSKRSPPKGVAAAGSSAKHSSAKVVPVSAAMLNKSEKVAFDIIVSAKRGSAGSGGVSGGNVSAKAGASVALTHVEIALMKSPLSKEVVPKTSPPKDGLAVTKLPMQF